MGVYLSKDVLYELYWNKGLSTTKIAELYCVDPETIRRYLIKSGIKRRELHQKKYTLSRERICRLYDEERLSTKSIAGIFGCSQSTIWAFMDKFGIKKRTPNDFLKWQSPGNSIKPNIQHSPTLSYILGVFLGDGWIYRKNHSYLICLEAKEKEFCESFARELNKIGLHPSIFQNNKRAVWRVTASSKMLYQWLNSLSGEGIRHLAIQYPTDFIRGFYESEGCLSVYQSKKYHYQTFQICIVNTEFSLIQLVKDILEMLQFHPTLCLRKPQQPAWKPVWALTLSRKSEVLRFLKAINPCIKYDLNIGIPPVYMTGGLLCANHNRVEFRLCSRTTLIQLPI